MVALRFANYVFSAGHETPRFDYPRIVQLHYSKILGAMLKEPLVNDETMSTLMCEVKRILNDSDHQDDPEPLTPNKLLLLSLPLDILKGHASDSTKHNA